MVLGGVAGHGIFARRGGPTRRDRRAGVSRSCGSAVRRVSDSQPSPGHRASSSSSSTPSSTPSSSSSGLRVARATCAVPPRSRRGDRATHPWTARVGRVLRVLDPDQGPRVRAVLPPQRLPDLRVALERVPAVPSDDHAVSAHLPVVRVVLSVSRRGRSVRPWCASWCAGIVQTPTLCAVRPSPQI